MIKHLEMIQSIIARMASNSFLIKGWSLTITTAIIAFAIDREQEMLAVVALVPVISFWLLDAYFLRKERLFRELYDGVRLSKEAPDFSMNTKLYTGDVSTTFGVAFSRTLIVFHGAIIIVVVALAIILSTSYHTLNKEHQQWQDEPSSASTTSEISGESTKSETSPRSQAVPPQDSKTHLSGKPPSEPAPPQSKN